MTASYFKDPLGRDWDDVGAHKGAAGGYDQGPGTGKWTDPVNPGFQDGGGGRYGMYRQDYGELNVQTGQYGGTEGAYRDQVSRFGREAYDARNRGIYAADWGRTGSAIDYAQSARGSQMSHLNQLSDLADLSKSSAASREVLANGVQASNMLQSQATVARGGLVGQRGAMAQAQQAGGMVQQQAGREAATVRAGEARDAAAQYGQAAAAMRSGDAALEDVYSKTAEYEANNRMRQDEANSRYERDKEDLRRDIVGGEQKRVHGQLNEWSGKREIAEMQKQQDRAATAGAVQGAGTVLAGVGAVARSADGSPKSDDGRAQRDADNYYSDEGLKTAVGSLSDRISSRTPGYSFNYKPGVKGEDPSKRNFGVMAQDLEKTPEGASVVSEGPQGKMVNTGKLALLHQAMMHDFNARLRSLEKKR